MTIRRLLLTMVSVVAIGAQSTETFEVPNEGGGMLIMEVTGENTVGCRFPKDIISAHNDIYLPDSVEHNGKWYRITSISPLQNVGESWYGILFLNNYVTSIDLKSVSYFSIMPKRTESVPEIVAISEEGMPVNVQLLLTTATKSYAQKWAGMYENVYYVPFNAKGDTTRALFKDEVYTLYYENSKLKAKLIAFNTNKTSVTLPNSVKQGGVSFPVGSIADSVFENHTELQEIQLPSSTNCIGKKAFAGCTNLTLVSSGNYLKDIGESAFEGCEELENIVFKGNVTDIGAQAFKGCTNLHNVYFEGNTVPKLGDNAFEGVTQGQLTIHFSESLQEQVKADPAWSTYFNMGSTDVKDGNAQEERALRYRLNGQCVGTFEMGGGLYVVKRGNKVEKRLYK